MPKSTKLSPDTRLWMHIYNGLKLVDGCTTLTPEQKQRVTELLRAANDVIPRTVNIVCDEVTP